MLASIRRGFLPTRKFSSSKGCMRHERLLKQTTFSACKVITQAPSVKDQLDALGCAFLTARTPPHSRTLHTFRQTVVIWYDQLWAKILWLAVICAETALMAPNRTTCMHGLHHDVVVVLMSLRGLVVS